MKLFFYLSHFSHLRKEVFILFQRQQVLVRKAWWWEPPRAVVVGGYSADQKAERMNAGVSRLSLSHCLLSRGFADHRIE